MNTYIFGTTKDILGLDKVLVIDRLQFTAHSYDQMSMKCENPLLRLWVTVQKQKKKD